jgi:hypothetical protein
VGSLVRIKKAAHAAFFIAASPSGDPAGFVVVEVEYFCRQILPRSAQNQV